MDRSNSINDQSFATPEKQAHRELWGKFVERHGRRYARRDWRVVCLPSLRREEIRIYRDTLRISPRNIIGVECRPDIFRKMQDRHRQIRLYLGLLSAFVSDWIRGEGKGKIDPWMQVANADFSSSLYFNLKELARLMLILDPRACLSVCVTTSHDFQTPLMGLLFQSLFGQLIGHETILAAKSRFFAESIRLGLVSPGGSGALPHQQRVIVDNSFLRELALLWVVSIGLLCHPFRDYREAPDFETSLTRLDRLVTFTTHAIRFTSATRRAREAERKSLRTTRTGEALGLVDLDLVGSILSSHEWGRLIGEPRIRLYPHAIRRVKYASRNTFVDSWFLKFVNGSASLSWSFTEVLERLLTLLIESRIELIGDVPPSRFRRNKKGERS